MNKLTTTEILIKGMDSQVYQKKKMGNILSCLD